VLTPKNWKEITEGFSAKTYPSKLDPKRELEEMGRGVEGWGVGGLCTETFCTVLNRVLCTSSFFHVQTETRRRKHVFMKQHTIEALIVCFLFLWRDFKSDFGVAQNIDFKNTRTCDAFATYGKLEVRHVALLTENNLDHLRILLALHFYHVRILDVPGWLRIKIADFSLFSTPPREEAPTN